MMTKDEQERLALVRRFKLRYRRGLRKALWSFRDDVRPDGGFIGIFSTWGRIARAGIAVFIIAAALLMFLRMLPWAMKEVDVSFGDNGAIRLHVPGHKEEWLTSVAASKLWVNTQIEIPSGRSVELKAWGVVDLALHRLVKAAQDDVLPHHPWVGPEGIGLGDNGAEIPAKDAARGELALYAQDGRMPRYGMLLACLVPIDTPYKDQPGRNNPRPIFRIYEYQNLKSIRNTFGTSCYLWLVVNDVVIDEKNIDASKRLYIDTIADELRDSSSFRMSEAYRKSVEEFRLKLGEVDENDRRVLTWDEFFEGVIKTAATSRWTYIASHRYWNLWYDDNIGEFQVKCVLD